MILHRPRKYGSYEIDRVPGNFLAAPNGIKVRTHTVFERDYDHPTYSKEFCREGNIFADLESLSLVADLTPRQRKISSMDGATAWNLMESSTVSIYTNRR